MRPPQGITPNPQTHKLPMVSDEVDRGAAAAAGDCNRTDRAHSDGCEASVGNVPRGPCTDGWGGNVSPLTDYGAAGFSRIVPYPASSGLPGYGCAW